MALAPVTNGNTENASDVQQIIDALQGTAGKGQPINLSALSDSTNFALVVKNNEATNSRALQILKSDGTVLLQIDKNGVVASPDGITASSQIVTLNGTQTIAGTKTFSGDLTGRRLKAAGTATVPGNIVLGAGWGNTASVTVAAGSTDARGSMTITANGTGIAAFPTVTYTFADGAWATAPFAIVQLTGGTGLSASNSAVNATATTTALSMTAQMTPAGATSYTYTWMILG